MSDSSLRSLAGIRFRADSSGWHPRKWCEVAVWGLLLLVVFIQSASAQMMGGMGMGMGGMGGGMGGMGGGMSGGMGGMSGGRGGMSGGMGGGMSGGGSRSGISVDAQGVVRTIVARELSGKLAKKRLEAMAHEYLPADMNTSSKLRKVSLVRLEAACQQFGKEGKHVTPEMQFLAGLQRIEYVFLMPETNDIVIAGPAEGFAFDTVGRAVGVSSGRPPLRLDDLVIALRSAESGKEIGCSIDPQPEKLAQMNRWIAANSSPATVEVAKARYDEMKRILGMQNVRVWGVPGESHFAEVLVEADYRMKRITIGLDKPPAKGLHSHLSMIGPGENTMQRWWFVPLYDRFVKSEDGLAFRFAGQRAQLLSQEEAVDQDGARSNAARTRTSIEKYAKHFTSKFPDLAAASPVFGELQSLIDLAVLGALLKSEEVSQQVPWKKTLFLDEKQATIAKRHVPKQVETCANSKDTGAGMVIGLVGGGVRLNAAKTFRYLDFDDDDEGELSSLRSETSGQAAPAEHAWWWD